MQHSFQRVRAYAAVRVREVVPIARAFLGRQRRAAAGADAIAGQAARDGTDVNPLFRAQREKKVRGFFHGTRIGEKKATVRKMKGVARRTVRWRNWKGKAIYAFTQPGALI